MEENPTLSEAVFNAISNWLGNDAMLTGFILITSELGSDGGQQLRCVTPETQPFHNSLGLVGYAEEFIRDDIRTAFLADFGDE